MKQRNRKRPERQRIHLAVIDVIGCVKTNDAGQKGPGSERAGGQRRDLGVAVAAGVDATGQTERDEGLDGVENGQNGNLRRGSE